MGARLAFMTRTLAAMLTAALVAVPLSAARAQPTVADLDTSVNCAVVFGVIASEQQRGAPGADRFPPLAERGKEFFVQVGARLIDEQRLTRDQARARFEARAMTVQGDLAAAPDPAARLREIAVPCLTLLDAAIPAR